MDKKKCTNCGEIKQISEYSFDKINGRHRSHCKECRNKFQREYRKKNKDKFKDYGKKYDLKNRKRRLELKRNRYGNNINGVKDKKKKYHMEHVEERRAYGISHYQKNKECYIKKRTLRDDNFGFVELFNNCLPLDVEVIWHHINNMIVVPIPKMLHISNLGSEHREKMVIEIEKLYGLNVVKLLETN